MRCQRIGTSSNLVNRFTGASFNGRMAVSKTAHGSSNLSVPVCCLSSVGPERPAHNRVVVGSSPTGSTVTVAQMVEQRIVVPQAAGSSPAGHLERKKT